MPATDRLSAAAAAPDGVGAPTWWEIPRLAGTLLLRYWPQLLFLFLAQYLAYALLNQAAVALAQRNALLAYAALAVLIVTQLIGTIAMFLVLRPSLPVLANRDALPDLATKPWVNALALALLPFFAYYAAWGLLDGIKRDFRLGYWQAQFLDDFDAAVDNVLVAKGIWVALLLAWAVRWYSKRRVEATGRIGWVLLATVCEAYWIYVGVAVIRRGLLLAREWWQTRAVYVAVADWWENPFVGLISLGPLKRVLDPLWDFATTAFGGLVLPLVWLAITAIVYGLDLRRSHRIDEADERLGQVAHHYRNAPLPVRMIVDKASAGWTSKGVPVVNSLRLVLRAGLPALLTLCVCWQLLAFLESWSWRLVLHFTGPLSGVRGGMIQNTLALLLSNPYGFRPALFGELIRIVLLAATFDRAIARLPRAAVPRLDSG